MDTALPQKFPFIIDRNIAKANCTGNRICTSCDIVVLDQPLISFLYMIPSCKQYILKRCTNVMQSMKSHRHGISLLRQSIIIKN